MEKKRLIRLMNNTDLMFKKKKKRQKKEIFQQKEAFGNTLNLFSHEC